MRAPASWQHGVQPARQGHDHAAGAAREPTRAPVELERRGAVDPCVALDDAALLSDAEVLLDECLDRLGRETGQAGYRAALAMRRMGQLRDHQGKTAEAIHCYLEAFGIFASHRATRYVKATRAELNRLLFPWGP